MGGDQQGGRLKHACKLCCKSFSCGRSLGGHMRTHVSSNSPSSAEADGGPASLPRPHPRSQSSRWVPGGFHGDGGYVLRKNPKKSWRLHDSVDGEVSTPPEKFCRECGKGFSSWKALFGHMRCHSVRSQERVEETVDQGEGIQEDGNDGDGSWDSGGAQKMLAVGRSVQRCGTMSAKTRRVSVAMATTAAPSLSASDIRKELEDVALCLMMLSRDAGCWGDFNSIATSSDRDSSVLEDAEGNTDGGDPRVCVPDRKKQKNKNAPCKFEMELEESDHVERSRDPAKRPRLKRTLADLQNSNSHHESFQLPGKEKFVAYKHKRDGDRVKPSNGSSEKPPHVKNTFECATCGKTFSSYQALGGHQTSHKRTKSCLVPKIDGREDSVETAVSTAQEEGRFHQVGVLAEEASSRSQKKANHHECGICFKVFPSGQALGGHKRRHFSDPSGSASASFSPAVLMPEELSVRSTVLDLNLSAPAPAATAAATDGDPSAGRGLLGFRPWWVGKDHNDHGEPLLRLVSS